MADITNSEDRDLIARCIKQDRRAQERFYRRFAPAALGVCRRYCQERTEAMDLLNIGMMKVFTRLDQYRGEGSLEGWIKRVVFHSTVDELRKKRKRPMLEIADWDRPTDAKATQSLFAEDLVCIINRLPETSQEVFWLFAVEGFSHAEIALQLGFSEGNSRWHLSKARQLLKEQLSTKAYKSNRYAG